MEKHGSKAPFRKIKSSNQTIFTNKKYIKVPRRVYSNDQPNNIEELKSMEYLSTKYIINAIQDTYITIKFYQYF